MNLRPLLALLAALAVAGEPPVPVLVSALASDAPALVSQQPDTAVVTTIILNNPGKEPLVLAGARWKATRTRALPHSANPTDIWKVDLADVEELATGTLPSDLPAVAGGASAAITITCTPKKFAAVALLLEVAGSWQRIGGFAVVPPALADRSAVPFIAGGSHQFERHRDFAWMSSLARLGVGLVRVNFAAQPGKDGALDWADADAAVAAFRANGLRVMMDFETPPGCDIPRLGGQPVWYAKNKANLIPRREALPVFEAYAREFLTRYKDVVRGVFCRNEPWEGGSISNYHASNRYYRDWHAGLYRAAQAADPGIAVLANDQITNFEDIFQGDPVALRTVTCTSHHTGFHDNRGAVQSAAAGLPAWETEDWSSHSDSYVIANLTRKLAGGFATSNPIASCFVSAGPRGPRYPSATAQAVAVFLHQTAGMHFAREAWTTHLPHAIAFSGGADTHRVLVFGRITAYGYAWVKDDGDQAWPQVTSDGVWLLPDDQRTLTAQDISGNDLPRRADGGLVVPLNEEPVYLASARGLDDLLARLATARAEYAKPALAVGLLDFTRRPATHPPLRVRVRNLRNHADTVTIVATPPTGWSLREAQVTAELAAGEERVFELPMAQTTERGGNSYPFSVAVSASGGTFTVREELHACIIPRATITIDGDLADWQDKAVPVMLTGGVVQPDGLETYMFPFKDLKASNESGTYARFAAAWDDGFLYLMAEVNDATATCRPSETKGIMHLMHAPPLQDLYWRHPQFRGTQGDGLKLAIDVFRVGQKRDAWIPPEFQQRIDTRYQRLSADYEFDLYPGAAQELVESYETVRDRYLAALTTAKDKSALRMPGAEVKQVGEPIPELWRLMAPDVPRGNGYPFQERSGAQQGLVDNARLVIRREGRTWRYEAAIPWSELAEVKPQVGREIRLSWYVLNDGRRALSWTAGRSACRGAKQSLHPTWQNSEAIETVWGFE